MINKVLEKLAVDVCILLETRSNSYINMNGIEAGAAGSGKWTMAGEDEDDSDAADDDSDDGSGDTAMGAHVGAGANIDEESTMDASSDINNDDDVNLDVWDRDDYDRLDGGETLNYQQTASEMTGKRWLLRTKLINDHNLLHTLVNRLAAFCAKSVEDVDAAMRQVAAIAPRKNAVAKFKLVFVAAPNNSTGKSAKPKPLTIKDCNALIRMYAILAKELQRYDTLGQISNGDIDFAKDYQRNPKWLKAHTVAMEVPIDTWKKVLSSQAYQPLRIYYDVVHVSKPEAPLELNATERFIGSWLKKPGRRWKDFPRSAARLR